MRNKFPTNLWQLIYMEQLLSCPLILLNLNYSEVSLGIANYICFLMSSFWSALNNKSLQYILLLNTLIQICHESLSRLKYVLSTISSKTPLSMS